MASKSEVRKHAPFFQRRHALNDEIGYVIGHIEKLVMPANRRIGEYDHEENGWFAGPVVAECGDDADDVGTKAARGPGNRGHELALLDVRLRNLHAPIISRRDGEWAPGHDMRATILVRFSGLGGADLSAASQVTGGMVREKGLEPSRGCQDSEENGRLTVPVVSKRVTDVQNVRTKPFLNLRDRGGELPLLGLGYGNDHAYIISSRVLTATE